MMNKSKKEINEMLSIIERDLKERAKDMNAKQLRSLKPKFLDKRDRGCKIEGHNLFKYQKNKNGDYEEVCVKCSIIG